MNDSDNTVQNQDTTQEPGTLTTNNGFEVLSAENSTSTDRKDENEGDQQNATKSEHPNEHTESPTHNSEKIDTQERADTADQSNDTHIHNEDSSRSQADKQEETQQENHPSGDQKPNEEAVIMHSQSPSGQNSPTRAEKTNQGHQENQEEHKELSHSPSNKEQHQESPKDVHKQQQPDHAIENKKDKREIFVPNYTVDNPEEEEKKSPQNQKPVQQVSNQNSQYQQIVYQQYIQQQQQIAQQFAQQFAKQGGAQQPQGVLPQNYFNPQFANPQGMFGQLPFMQQQPVFLPILDVCAEYQKGNFLPGIHCLYYNLVPRDHIDITGYNILHHAVSYNNVDVVIALLDHLKIDIHLRSKTNQSCVMIASNFGFNEMIKVLLDRGGKLDEQDDTRFTALLYCIKQGNLSSFLYLISRGANYHLTDVNGCSVVHWAAYKNNVFLLRFFRRMGLDMNAVDLAGFTPLQRAISSDGIDAVKYFLEDLKIPITTALQPDTITNQAIKKLVLNQLPTPKGFVEELKKSIWNTFNKAPQVYTYGFYLINIAIAFLCYTSGIVPKNELNYVYHIIFFVFSLYFAAYTFWYFIKSSDSILKLKTFAYQRLGGGPDNHNTSTLIDSSREMTVRSPYKHDYLDSFISKGNFSLLDKKQDPDYPYPSFLHELYFTFDKGDWERVAMFEDKKYCPTTLLPKKPKTKFCKETNTFVQGFNHYSQTLKRPIDKNIHPFYLLLLIQQTSLLFLYVLAAILTFYNDRTGSLLMIIPETLYLQALQSGFVFAAYLAIVMIYLSYSSFFSLIELYCLIKNLTYNEFFNSHRYPYLYRPNPFASGASQQFVKIYYNPYDKGPWKNICEYISRILH